MSEKEELFKVSQLLKDGKSILYPTDTIWGLGCDATNEEAVQKIQKIKGRAMDKSFIILVNSDAMLNRYIPEISEVAWDLIDLSEKPLTIIFPSAGKLAKSVINKDGSVAVRMVKSGFCAQLLQRFNHPIVSTSANISGEDSPNTFEDISTPIKEAVDHVVPKEFAGESTGKASSIIKLDMNGRVKIIRH